MQRATFFIGLLGLLLVPASASAQAWVKSPGTVYAKVYAGTFNSNGEFDNQGDFVDPSYAYSNVSAGAYLEAGLLPRLGMSLGASFYRATNTVEERTRYINSGPGDLTLGLHYQIARVSLCSFAGALTGSFPLYEGEIEAGATSALGGAGGEEAFLPALGDGSIDITPSVSVGCGLAPIRGWASAAAGYRVRTIGFGDVFTYSADIGSFVWPRRLAVTARVDGVQRFTADSERPTKSYVSVGAGTILNLWGPLALELSGSYIPTGAFVARGWSVLGGVSFSGDVF